MQELPEISVQDFESALLANEQRLYSLTGGRSSFSESSAGVTLLELLTWLQTEQQRNMNRITSGELRSLCALYGYQPRTQRPAEAFAAYSSEKALPAGTKLRAEDIVFETQQDSPAGTNSAAAYAKVMDGRAEPYRFDPESAFCFEIFDDSDYFVMGFTQPLSSGEEHRLLLCFDDYGRVLPHSMEGFDSGTEIIWQYFGGDGGNPGWHDVELLSDETHGCFCTGRVIFRVNGQHERNGRVYPLRAKLVKRGFDRLPRFCGAFVQNCPVLQLDTRCACVGFRAEEFEKNAMYFSSPLAAEGELLLFVRTKQGWRTADSLDIAYEADSREGGFRLVTSSRSRLSEIFGQFAVGADEPLLLLSVYEQEYVRDFSRLRSDGTSGQRITLNFTGIFPERLRLLVGADGVYSEWRRVPGLAECGGRDEVFEIDGDTLVFGDNIHGKVLPQGDILIISLALTTGAAGNIPAGAFAPGDVYTAARPAAARGGTTAERPEQTFARILSEPKEKTLLSEKDFAECAVNTPGLLIKQAQVFQTVDKNGETKPNAVTVVVHPDIPEPHRLTAQLGWYITALKRRMEPLCPMTLELTVRFPAYIPADISVRVRSRDYYISAEKTVRSFITGYFEELRHGIDRSQLLRELNSLPGITAVSGLSVRCSGAETTRRPDGSVSAPEWCRLYLRNLDAVCEE